MNESIIMNFLQSQNIERNRQQEKQILYLDITELEASKENFYGIRDLEALKASISLKGLLQPILVTKGEEGRYTVLGGGRRRQAIEELVNEGREDLRKVPCIISDARLQGEDTEDQEEDREMKELLNRLDIISANSFREKTDWEKLEETVQIGNIIKDLKKLGKIKGNVREMQAELSGTTGTQIARYNAILNNLSEELTEAFKNNDFGISVAYELSRLTEEYQKQAWELFLENKILTLPDTERLHRLQKEAEQIQGQVEMHEWLQKEEDCKETEDQEELEEETKEIKPEVQQETLPKEKLLKKPDKQERGYLKDLAKHLIMSMHDWFLKDYTNRVLMVSKSPKEIKEKIGQNHRTWYFSTEKGVAHANLFEDYVQVWDERSKCMGDYDWFYLAAAIQSTWNEVALENAAKTVEEPEQTLPESQQIPIESRCITGQNPSGNCNCCGNDGMVECCVQCGDRNSCNAACGWLEPVATQQQQKETVQQETKEESKHEPVEEEQQTEEYEKYEQASEKTDIELLKEELEKAQRYLTMLLEAYTEKDIRVRRQKLIVGALAGMLAEIDNEIPEPVQPPLPEMKNNDKRKEWLNNYRSWGIWYKDEHTGATYYRYQFENGADLIVEEYESESEYTGIYISSYLHLIGGPEPVRKSGIPKWTRNKKYNRYPNNETELVEFLKELQKRK